MPGLSEPSAATPISYADALSEAFAAGGTKSLVLGNGFSRALFPGIFSYGALFDRADFSKLDPSATAAFEALGTRDFEDVMRALRDAAVLDRLYSGSTSKLATAYERDASALRDVLAAAIATNHPDHPNTISDLAYAACRSFLAPFGMLYTLNYDLLLYWTVMRDEAKPSLSFDDGFRTPDGGPAEYVSWDDQGAARSQTLYYLHGALHLFDAGAEIKKFTWKHTSIRLIEQVRSALVQGLFPVVVAEGESERKLTRIRHSDYLARGLRSLGAVTGSVFVFGHSFGENDEHVLRRIEKGKASRLYVSLRGEPSKDSNRRIIERAHRMQAQRREARPLAVRFYRADSANVWGEAGSS